MLFHFAQIIDKLKKKYMKPSRLIFVTSVSEGTKTLKKKCHR